MEFITSKFRLLSLGLMTVVCLTLVFPLAAQANMNKNYQAPAIFFAPSVGYYDFSDKRHLDNAEMTGITLGYVPTPTISIEGYFGSSAPDNTKTNATDRTYAYLLNLSYHFGAEPKRAKQVINPYLLAGIGAIDQNDTDDNQGSDTLLAVNAGIGLEYYMQPSIGFFADMRDIYSPSGGKNEFLATIGIKFMFDAASFKQNKPNNSFEPAQTKGTSGFYELQEKNN